MLQVLFKVWKTDIQGRAGVGGSGVGGGGGKFTMLKERQESHGDQGRFVVNIGSCPFKLQHSVSYFLIQLKLLFEP